jgi:hypothetical protein
VVKRVVLVVGGLLVAAGLVLALIPMTVTLSATNVFNPSLTSAQTFSCGPLWGEPDAVSPLGTKLSDALVACDAALGSRAVFVYLLIGAGVLALVGAALYRPAVATRVAT